MLHRLFTNLFDNADLHGGGLKTVRLECTGDHVEVQVADSGPGVPAAERQRVFERFVRVGSRGSRPGTGLGLSLVAESVRAHAGTVSYQETRGGGATFVVALPVTGRGEERAR